MRRCSHCGHEGAGVQCARCRKFGTFLRYQKLSTVPKPEAGSRLSTGVEDLDKLLGGGMRRGVVYRLSGSPGAGKSTLSLDIAIRVASAIASTGPSVLYVCGEEAAENVRDRAEDRLSATIPDGLVVSQDESLEDLTEDFDEALQLIIVDSLNAWKSKDVNGAPGCNGQLIHGARGLSDLATETGAIFIALSHVNADGDAAGAVAIDHWVGATLVMTKPEDDPVGTLKITKNRYGRAPLCLNYTHEEKGIGFSDGS